MTSSLVGSEMCIRDRRMRGPPKPIQQPTTLHRNMTTAHHNNARQHSYRCLLYTSDAADDM
eukprot:9905622-Prorocentrum_lima.AAC.1